MTSKTSKTNDDIIKFDGLRLPQYVAKLEMGVSFMDGIEYFTADVTVLRSANMVARDENGWKLMRFIFDSDKIVNFRFTTRTVQEGDGESDRATLRPTLRNTEGSREVTAWMAGDVTISCGQYAVKERIADVNAIMTKLDRVNASKNLSYRYTDRLELLLQQMAESGILFLTTYNGGHDLHLVKMAEAVTEARCTMTDTIERYGKR